MKNVMIILALLLTQLLGAQNFTEEVKTQEVQFDLRADNMQKYVGKVNREEFEKVVGTPVGEETGFLVYVVNNVYDKEVTAIRCGYRESDGKLISVQFGTPHYLAYWINFSNLKGYNAKVNSKLYKDEYGNLRRINFKLGKFGMQILDIHETPYFSTAIINYHTVK
jgi:hypothetical protein